MTIEDAGPFVPTIRVAGPTTEEQSLPVGNGREGANIWMPGDGSVHLLLSHAEAYSETSRLSKIGLARIMVDAPAFRSGEYRQTLDLRRGLWMVETITGPSIVLRIFADANHPAIRVLIESEEPVFCRAEVRLSRPQRREVPRAVGGAWAFEEGQGFSFCGSKEPFLVVEPDEWVDAGRDDALCWCHHNPYSFLQKRAGHPSSPEVEDPLDGLTFGGFLHGNGWHRAALDSLEMRRPARRAALTLAMHCGPARSSAGWAEVIRRTAGSLPPPEDVLPEHEACWAEFWERSWIVLSGDEDADRLTRAYAGQRYLNACAGRGRWPIRFNGSMFNVAWSVLHPDGKSESYDADYRRWHCGFFGQNTRLIYWPMLLAGDFDLMRPYFDLYLGTLPAARHRARLVLGREGRGGAYFWETPNLWDNAEVALDPGKSTTWRYFTSALEMLFMAFDYAEFTGDEAFVSSHLAPLARAILDFYLDYGEIDPSGTYRLVASSTESYPHSTNPTPDLAGLAGVLPRAIRVLARHVPEGTLAEWRQWLAALPPLPTRDATVELPLREDRKELFESMGLDVSPRLAEATTSILAPAEAMPSPAWNIENPETYPIFPFRLFGAGLPSLPLARDTFHYRRFRHDQGWAQDPIIAARLGLTAEAKRLVVGRSRRIHPGAVFPAFWEAGFDWIPDQDNGGVLATALQSMLLQGEKHAIHLLPAWPAEWNVHFKLHAPSRTTVEGKVEKGRVTKLIIEPADRPAEVVFGAGYHPPSAPAVPARGALRAGG